MTTLTYYLVRSTLFLLVCPSPFVIIHSVNLKYSLLFLSSSRHLFRTESRYRFMFHQRCIQNPVKHLRWSVLNKSLNINLLFSFCFQYFSYSLFFICCFFSFDFVFWNKKKWKPRHRELTYACAGAVCLHDVKNFTTWCKKSTYLTCATWKAM